MGNNEIDKCWRFTKRIIIVMMAIMAIMASLLVLLVFIYYIYFTPSKNKFDRKIEWEYFWEKDKKGECVVDLAETMGFEWDSMCYYSSAYEYRDIIDDLGTYLPVYKDLGTRILFMRNGLVVYTAEWFPYPYEDDPGGAVFLINDAKKVFYPNDAKFRVFKQLRNNVSGDSKYLFLQKIE